jgi:hypothetical protein
VSVFEIEKGSREEFDLREYSSAFSAWNSLLDLEIRLPDSLLSRPQRRSFRIIRDWIISYHDGTNKLIPTEECPRSCNEDNLIIHSCSHQRDQASLSDGDVLLFLDSDGLSWKLRQPEYRKREENEIRFQQPVQYRRSAYDSSLSGVFQHEFGLHGMYGDRMPGLDWSKRLIGMRKQAAVDGYCHRIAAPCLDWWAANRPEKEDTKCTTAEEELFAACGRLDGGLDQISSPRRVGSRFTVCPWLPEPSGLPFYLWDVEKDRTVETSTLTRPRYTVISHTWGRWRKSTPPVRVKGVDN